MAMALTERQIDKKQQISRYRDLIEAKVTGAVFDESELAELVQRLGFLPVEHSEHVSRASQLSPWCKRCKTIVETKPLVPQLAANVKEILRRHAATYAQSPREEIERDKELAEAQKALADARAIIADGNSFYPLMDQLIDDEFSQEPQTVRHDIEKLREQAKELRRALRPDRLIVNSGDPESPAGSKKTIIRDAEHWSRVAQYAENENERKAAEKRLIEISRNRRELADVMSEIDALTAIAEELEAREVTPRWFKM